MGLYLGRVLVDRRLQKVPDLEGLRERDVPEDAALLEHLGLDHVRGADLQVGLSLQLQDEVN